jgi:hypothetical protein
MNKDSVDYQSRKFKVTLTGTSQPIAAMTSGGGTFSFRIPPPSDIAFSDKYRSCLILLRSVSIMNVAGGRAVTGVGQLTGEGINPIWITSGVAVPVGVDPTAGIVIDTDLPCKQHSTAQLDEVAGTVGVAGSGRYSKTIPNEVSGNSIQARIGADQNLDMEGIQEFRIGGNPAPHAVTYAGVLIQRRPVWYWKTEADILDEGLLGATPFGRDLTITLKDARTNTECWLKSCAVGGGAANIQHQQTSIIAEFEFLMMP